MANIVTPVNHASQYSITGNFERAPIGWWRALISRRLIALQYPCEAPDREARQEGIGQIRPTAEISKGW
jgi:hypothetical protein